MFFRDCLKEQGIYTRMRIRLSLWWVSLESRKTKIMWENLFNEPRVEKKDWEELIKKLINASPGRKKTKQVILEFCRDNRTLRGKRAIIPSNTTLGHAATQAKFTENMKKILSGIRPAAIESQIRSYLLSPSKHNYPPNWGKKYMAQYLIWATFIPGSMNPFSQPSLDGDTILCLLGLIPDSSPVLIFEYDLLAVSHPPLVPTFFDAYANSDWNPYFRVAPINSEYGKTNPPKYCPEKNGRPEVVHDKIQFKQLKAPFRQIL